MGHPWNAIPLEDYEAHMKLETVGQLSALNKMMQQQLSAYPIRTAAILGIAGGNGLEHVAPPLQMVYGIDINSQYLDACAQRYPNLRGILTLLQMDLCDPESQLPQVDLVIANLLVEYLGLSLFQNHIRKAVPPYVSCIIQQNPDDSLVSPSPYAYLFRDLEAAYSEIHPDDLISSMAEISMEQIHQDCFPLPNGKALLRLDFQKK